MSNSIVTVNVAVTQAPAPSTLQGTGAVLSQGGTTLAVGAKSLITQPSDLTALLPNTKAITSITWLSSVATVTTAAPHGFTNGDTVPLTISGATPTGYNGTFNCLITGASTFTYPLVSNPGSETVPGVYTEEDVAELTSQINTFFAQGSQKSVYVLELGAGDAADGVTELTTWLAANPGVFYSYLTPRSWGSEATFLTLAATLEAPTAKTYFYVTMTNGNYTGFTAAMKCVKGMIEAPSGLPSTEFSHASDFQHDLSYAPSSTNRVNPNAFAYLFDVTPFPTPGNAAILAAYKAAGVNVVATGAEGGVSNDILKWGTTMDKNDFTFWYSVDWVQINLDLSISNAVINGSNNPANPLYYNQDGINRLQAVAASVMSTGVADGMILGQVVQTQLDPTTLNNNIENGLYDNVTVVNAVPFVIYTQLNPNDYAAGVYNGLTAVFVPARGFTSIAINVNVTSFVNQ